jgi:hypothetical protein
VVLGHQPPKAHGLLVLVQNSHLRPLFGRVTQPRAGSISIASLPHTARVMRRAFQSSLMRSQDRASGSAVSH